MDRDKFFKDALEFVKEKHKGQVRAGNVPAWHHLARVSGLLSFVLEKHGECGGQERSIIVTAALGHDVLEDTKVTEKEVMAVFGPRGSEIIKSMTNKWGDKNVMPYVKQVAGSEEAVRLVKLSDLYDNHISVVYNLHILGLKWTHSYFLPIVTPMRLAVTKTKFKKFKKTAEELVSLVNSAAFLLDGEIRRFEEKNKKRP
ncbi:hypothetical protein A2662_02740 [Candidatus Giovannonibacteria bacterium RIFCSPHIGHO2_01_FULL_45_33]|uniref:HD/PDEase domain-containing protein n=1 Tax=Candidatus Giovannonibacteria bacterium RIFCSPLOWO2_01_FULL_45_34 TaxID=1798351 RepID=A0A1F5X1F8_9BACT|nr:MAG: hypothetical protein A2662_02740 [Candidatus Giovannonibacteria bacterium RIFCSPHIGHO2_01_FULL_45_33]OGF70934.1 MAG: hypothetical protein A3C73_00995 [Candidatus Giovannonibacteria bacterium RIFCSPHIGHO2_02_FULL_44_11]OGF81734.1 MAG: hypothetical protein A2930_04005 [Candidatus Giovannonibacteria bacterium RIFCSPLOWO2_01_FULL_45_34]